MRNLFKEVITVNRNLKGGMEGIIAAIILAGLVVALLLGVVVPMSNQGDELIDKTTNKLVTQQGNMRPTN